MIKFWKAVPKRPALKLAVRGAQGRVVYAISGPIGIYQYEAAKYTRSEAVAMYRNEMMKRRLMVN